MHSKSFSLPSAIVTASMFAAAVLFTSCQAVAQSPEPKTATTWQDLGFNNLPEGISTDVIPLFEGLNEARGTWSFEGKVAGGDAATSLKGSLQIAGNPKGGMIPGWQMACTWHAKEPEHLINYMVMASPGKPAFDLRLFRIGPMKISEAGKDKSKIKRAMFKGTWNLKNRTIAWTKSGFPNRINGQPAKKDSSKPKESFDMVVAADGKISIQNSKLTSPGQFFSGKTILRTAKPPEQPVILTGKHEFKTAAEIADPRIKPYVPPQATEISLISERGGHFARYKIAEADLMKLLNQLWEAKKGSSAHKRETMSGESEPANEQSMARFSERTGWPPLEKAMIYYGPSKSNGAMTTYYYDRETGITYHDRGYW